jgi:hypothetical protein
MFNIEFTFNSPSGPSMRYVRFASFRIPPVTVPNLDSLIIESPIWPTKVLEVEKLQSQAHEELS